MQAGIPDAVRKHVDHRDVKVADSARGTLLQLGLLDDEKAQVASKALEEEAYNDKEGFDVFLSHKRSDAKDFARGKLMSCGGWMVCGLVK